jgi:hypothetical protein
MMLISAADLQGRPTNQAPFDRLRTDETPLLLTVQAGKAA